MRLLALDTATEACSAALLIDGELTARYEVPGRGHAERLLPMVDALLAAAGLTVRALDAIAFGRGPGAFTGVRIAAGLAQGLALGADRPVVPISDLAANARLALDRHAAETGVTATRALVALDARLGEVYWGDARVRADGGVELVVERLARPDALEPFAPDETPGGAGAAPPGAPAVVVAAGHGWSAYPALGARFAARLASCRPELLPRAHEVARLAALELAAGRVGRAEDALPVYLRDDVATRSGRAPGAARPER